jgi:hypothetical protein
MSSYNKAKSLMEEILTVEEIKAIAAYVEDPVQWWLNALQNKAECRMKAALIEHSEFNPVKLTHERKRQEVGKLKLESAKDRNAREQAKMKAKLKEKTKKG